jgi:hypothetical protein
MKNSQNSRKSRVFLLFCWMIEGSGSESKPHTYGSGSGSKPHTYGSGFGFGRPKNIRDPVQWINDGESETWSQSPWVSSVSRSTRTAVMWETGLAAAVGEAAVVSGRSGPPAAESVDIRRSRAKQGCWKIIPAHSHCTVHYSPVLGDPDPDPHVLGPPGSGSISQRGGSGSGSGSFLFLINVLSGLK